MVERIPVAILGAGGYIGQHFARMLADHPSFEVVRLVGSDRGKARSLASSWHLTEDVPAELAGVPIEPASPALLAREGVRIAFSALPSGTARALESELVRRGVHVFTNASDHRMDRDVPLLLPEVNADHLPALRKTGRTLLVANANCTATGLVLALAPLWPVLRPRAIHVASYQALSGAGLAGVTGLQATDNVVPYIADEEEKLAAEAQRILGSVRGARVRPSSVRFLANCARVPVRDGHLEAVTVDARARPSEPTLRRTLEQFDPLRDRALPSAPHPPILLRAEPDRPQPVRDRWAGSPARARGMAVVVGRVRWTPPYFRFFVLSHNAVRGGAGGSVLNAELALDLGLVG
jgi:aspartate-semialdehyde dehydrogenase